MQIRKNCKNESKLSNDILVFMSHDEGGVDHMKDSLYSRKHQGGIQDVRAPLSPSEARAPGAGGTQGGGGARPGGGGGFAPSEVEGVRAALRRCSGQFPYGNCHQVFYRLRGLFCACGRGGGAI